MKYEFESLRNRKWDTVWLGDEGVGGVHILTSAAWPQRGCFRAKAKDQTPVYLWQDCEADAAEEYAELFGVEDPDTVDVRNVSREVRELLQAATSDFLDSL